MAIKVNRVNRNFGIKVHLYFNSSSYNRPSDETPRFFLTPVELLSVEKVAFTRDGGRNNGYGEHGNRLWKGKPDDTLTQAQILSIYEEIKNSHPYGYVDGDTASTNKYIFDVKENESFQSFYRAYWDNNSSEITQPRLHKTGFDYPYPYIEFNVNEIITYKHNVGTVPELPESMLKWGEYSSLTASYYSEPPSWACNNDVIEVSAVGGLSTNYFLVEDRAGYLLKLGTTGNRYRFDLLSGEGWPTGEGGTFSGYRFRFSTGEDGTHGGFNEYTTNVSFPTSPEVGEYYVAVETKTDGNHPHYGNGSISGYSLSGSGGTASTLDSLTEGATLTLRRESTYYFVQYAASNSGHPIYLSTDPSGVDYSNIYNDGVALNTSSGNYAPGNLDTWLEFTVPLTAPDTLYYACLNHSYMGGQINIVDAPDAPYTGSIPGESAVVTFNGNNTDQLFYYSPDSPDMGGNIVLQNNCDSSIPIFD